MFAWLIVTDRSFEPKRSLKFASEVKNTKDFP